MWVTFILISPNQSLLTNSCQSCILALIRIKSFNTMRFQSIRIITDDIKRAIGFYEKVLTINAKWFTEDFAELSTDAITIAIGSIRTLSLFGDDLTRPGGHSNIIIEFLVADVDNEYLRIKQISPKIVQKPTTMPWGNRSLLCYDPDGNLLNFFTPVTPEAIQKFS